MHKRLEAAGRRFLDSVATEVEPAAHAWPWRTAKPTESIPWA
jgi:hypothetical protein